MAAGYKGKVAMAQGAFYAPYKPEPVTWQGQLKFWEGELMNKYGWGDAHNVKSDCMDLMQRNYPGKYTLSWVETEPMQYHLKPVFNDPKHETMWKLKYES